MDLHNKMERQANKIADYYDQLQQHSFELIVDYLNQTKSVLNQSDKDSILEWRLKALSQMGQLTTDVVEYMRKALSISKSAIYQLIQKDGLHVANDINTRLAKMLNQPTHSISSVTTNIINSYADQTFLNINNYVNQTLISTNYNDNTVVKAYQQILEKTVLDVTTGNKTPDKALKDSVYKVRDNGLKTILVDKGKHNWTIEGYTRTVLTSTAHRVYNEARMQSMKEYDVTLAIMSSHPAARPMCAPIQGKVVNIVSRSNNDYDTEYPSIYDYGYGTPAGTQGINCRHMLNPYIKGVSHNYEKQYDPDEAIENAKIQQKQRYYERNIRRVKADKELADRIGDNSGSKKDAQEIKSNQRKIRELINSNKFLTRQRSREKFIPTPKKELDAKAAKIRLTQNVDKQLVHIYNTSQYKSAVKNRKYEPSYFLIDSKKLDKIVQENVDMSKVFDDYQFIKAEENIAVYKNKDKQGIPTGRIKVMQSKSGYHAIPAPPEDKSNVHNT